MSRQMPEENLPPIYAKYCEDVAPAQNFQKDLEIDPMALDVEFMMQPQKFYTYSEILARATRELDRLKLKFEIVQAQIDNRIRSSSSGDKKPTETAIRSLLIQDPEYVEASEALSDQKEIVEKLSAGVKAFEQRKVSLENLAKLQAQNYYASPKEPRNLQTEYEKRKKQDEANKLLAEASASRRK